MVSAADALPVREDWFEINSPDELGVQRVRERYARGGSIWFVEGRDKCLLMDTGIGVGDVRSFLEAETSKPIIAFASVGYYDHAGGLHQFDHRLIHEDEAHRVKLPNRHNTVLDYYFDGALSAVPTPVFDPEKYEMQACEPTRLLRDGDMIDLGDRLFEVLHLPGITKGTCGLFERETGALFTGEALVWNDMAVYDGEPAERSADADQARFRQSIERLLCLPSFAVYPGHGKSETPQTMTRVIAAYLAENGPSK